MDSVKAKILELIQCWSHAFRENSDYKAVTEAYNELKAEGNQLLYSTSIILLVSVLFLFVML